MRNFKILSALLFCLCILCRCKKDKNTRNLAATTIVGISAGQDFSFFITADHTLWATGSNTVGQLGNGAASVNKAVK